MSEPNLNNLDPEIHADIINQTRPKYSEMDMRKVKDEYERQIQEVKQHMKEYEDWLKEKHELLLTGENIGAYVVPISDRDLSRFGFSIEIELRDTKFIVNKIEHVEVDHRIKVFIDIEGKTPQDIENIYEYVRSHSMTHYYRKGDTHGKPY